jgi:hypothetical protein
MRFRLLFILAAACAAARADGQQARVLSVSGSLDVHRGGKAWMAAARMDLAPGDRLITDDNSYASLLVGQGVVYMGASTSLSLREGASNGGIDITQGQARIVVSEKSDIHLHFLAAYAKLCRGVYVVTVDRDGARVTNIQGRAVVAAQGVRAAAFQQETGQDVHPGESIVVPPSGNGATLDEESTDTEDEVEERRRHALQEDAAEAAEGQQLAQQPVGDATPTPTTRGGQGPGGSILGQNFIASPAISSSFGGLSSSFSSIGGALFADAAQSTNQGQSTDGGGPFPGNIHLLTAETKYAIDGVALEPEEFNEIFSAGPAEPVYFSIGTGALPQAQVFTDFQTASDVVPRAIAIPGFDAYVVKFTQFGLVDAGLDPSGAEQNVQGINGLVGADPPAPSIFNATPTADERAVFNELATFALGEFRLRPNGGDDGDMFELAVRRSDQDRLIIKDGGGNDANDVVTPHPDVTFTDVPDPRFQPAAATVKSPDPTSFDQTPTTVSKLNELRRAAATTILADQLHDFAQRTGQTRFVIDGKIIDISGYKR